MLRRTPVASFIMSPKCQFQTSPPSFDPGKHEGLLASLFRIVRRG